MVMNISALGDGGERRFMGFRNIIKITAVTHQVLDFRIDIVSTVAELFTGINDRGNLHAADIADFVGFGHHGGSGPGDKSNLSLLHIITRYVSGHRLPLIATHDRELHLRKAFCHF